MHDYTQRSQHPSLSVGCDKWTENHSEGRSGQCCQLAWNNPTRAGPQVSAYLKSFGSCQERSLATLESHQESEAERGLESPPIFADQTIHFLISHAVKKKPKGKLKMVLDGMEMKR